MLAHKYMIFNNFETESNFMKTPIYAIIKCMKTKSLSETNRHLKNKAKARKLLRRSVASSTAIETGEPIDHIEGKLSRLHSVANRVKLA